MSIEKPRFDAFPNFSTISFCSLQICMERETLYKEMDALGKHVIAELYGCNTDIINNEELVENIMLESAELSGATIIKPVFHKFSPHGVSGIIMVAESHLSIHTWPEYGYCAIDIFTCGNVIDNYAALEHIKTGFQAKSISIIEMKRGILNLGVEIRHKPDIQDAHP